MLSCASRGGSQGPEEATKSVRGQREPIVTGISTGDDSNRCVVAESRGGRTYLWIGKWARLAKPKIRRAERDKEDEKKCDRVDPLSLTTALKH